DYYYDSYYASSSFAVGPPRVAPPMKRPRLMSSGRNKTKESQKAVTIPPFDQLKVYSNPDILICGNCREMFTELQELLDHKKTYCKLRFTCKCDSYNGTNDKSKINGDEHSSAAALLCVQCKDVFHNAWDLMVHAQAAHMVNIYELGVPAMANCSSPDSPTSAPDKSPPTGRFDVPNIIVPLSELDLDHNPILFYLGEEREKSTERTTTVSWPASADHLRGSIEPLLQASSCEEVRELIKATNIEKAPGPDRITNRALKSFPKQGHRSLNRDNQCHVASALLSTAIFAAKLQDDQSFVCGADRLAVSPP
ncbi:hypothetical protein ILUMI_22306, partial [Ignelater luminosus]